METAPLDSGTRPVRHLDVALDLEGFMRTLLRHLAGTLEDVVGIPEASGFISVVGQKMGDELGTAYKKALGVKRLSREQVAMVMVDLKQRIQGDFYVIEQDDEKIVLGNLACPFAEQVIGRPSLCMMTSNVFGVLAAESTGYAKVALEKTIARGDRGCRVVVYLKPGSAADASEGREYVQEA